MRKTTSSLLALLLFAVLSSACDPDPTRNIKKSNDYKNAQNREPDTGTEFESGIDPDAVVIFRERLQSEVKRCRLLSTVFDIERNVGRPEFKAGKYYFVSAIATEYGIRDPSYIADIDTRYDSNANGRLTRTMMVDIYANTAALTLYGKGRLTTGNALKLATAYAQTIKDVARRMMNPKYPRSKVATMPSSVLEFVIRQGMSIKENIAEICLLQGDEWMNLNNTQPIQLGPSYSTDKNPLLKECDNVCKMNDKAIDIFYSTLRQAVKDCSTLTELFKQNPPMTPSKFSRGIEYESLFIMYRLGAKNVAILADFMARYVRDIKNLKPCVVEAVYAKSLAKYLLSEKIINSQNAKDLALDYAKALKDSAGLSLNLKYPRSKVVTLSFAWRNFLVQQKALNAEKAQRAAYYLGNEWRCASSYGSVRINN